MSDFAERVALHRTDRSICVVFHISGLTEVVFGKLGSLEANLYDDGNSGANGSGYMSLVCFFSVVQHRHQHREFCHVPSVCKCVFKEMGHDTWVETS
jgi:hypothetical protein